VAFADQIHDPDTHKFTTPSGKIEIYSLAMAAKPDRYGLGAMPPIPTWFDPVEPEVPGDAVQPEVAGAHAFDPRQPAAAGARRSGQCVDEPGGCARARDRERPEGAHLQRPRLDPAAGQSNAAHCVVSIKEGAWVTPDNDGTDTVGALTS
jgi:anaerobic dimethyl sulfoxide reductase subunit A